MRFWLKSIPIPHAQITTPNYTFLSGRGLDHSDFFETVFSTVNLFLLVNVLALRCSCGKLSLLNPLFVVIFQPAQIPLDIIHTKFLKKVMGSACLLFIVNGFISTDGIADYLKKASVAFWEKNKLKKKASLDPWLHNNHALFFFLLFRATRFILKSFGWSNVKPCQEVTEWSNNWTVTSLLFFVSFFSVSLSRIRNIPVATGNPNPNSFHCNMHSVTNKALNIFFSKCTSSYNHIQHVL